MFSPDIVSSDAFLDMSVSARDLYFQLGMSSDDDGFVNPRRIMRNVGASDADLTQLLGKRFVLPFENGVVVVKHWRINNFVRKDRYKETLYIDQKSMLRVKRNGAYTLDESKGLPISEVPWKTDEEKRWSTNGQPLVNAGKVRLGKDNKEIAKAISPLSEIREVREDAEGNEKPPKKKSDPAALTLRETMYSELEKETGVRPTPNMGDYIQIQKALKHMKSSDVLDMLHDAMSAKQIHTVRSALTDRAIDIKREELI